MLEYHWGLVVRAYPLCTEAPSVLVSASYPIAFCDSARHERHGGIILKQTVPQPAMY